MRTTFKLIIASVLSVALSVATVMCCCSASAAMAHFHKAVVCSHCQGHSAHDNSSNPAGTCHHQFQSAEFFHSFTISSPVVSSTHASLVLVHHWTIVLPSLSLSYPPGSPPLGISFIPLYLRTFSLRI
jgi:hypothetical protein